MKATWRGATLAESDDTVVVENPEPKDAAANIRGRVAFWNGVQVGPG